MDTPRETRKQTIKAKSTKRKNKTHKSQKLFRRKSLKSLGNFMSRIVKTLGTLAHLGDADQPDAGEDDDGGFGDTLSAHNSGNYRENSTRKAVAPASSYGSVKERLSWCYGEKTPGVQGLKNHGNTCFMNAVVQCLSNTELLAEYLGLEQYKCELYERRINGVMKSEEVRGEVTEKLASLVRALWTLDYTPQLSVEFKSAVSKYGSQFKGNAQHDALEFLLWLLDSVHEDANLSTNNNHSGRAKSSSKDSVELEESCSPCPANSQQPGTRHSFVQEHFQAQYRSSLTCPHCLKQSNTFDPFLCISLPIPLRQTRALNVTLVFNNEGQRFVRVGLAVPLFGSVSTLRAMVAEEGKISSDQVILTEMNSNGFQRSFSDEDDMTSISESDVIYAFQAPPLSARGGSMRFSGIHHSLPSSPYIAEPKGHRLPPSGTLSSEFLNQGGSSKILLLLCNVAGSGQEATRFGPPFLMRVERTLSWDHLRQSVCNKLYLFKKNIIVKTTELFNMRVVGGSASCSYLSPNDSRPLCHPTVDRALKFCGPGGPLHVKLVIEWENRIKECLFGNIQEEVIEDAESVRIQQQNHVQQHSCTLDECFQLYTKEEQLAPDDAWKCPHCKQMQQGMVKMSLWTLPDILILHLKRFRQVGKRRNKLSSLIHFPVSALDMTPHVVKRSQSMRNLAPWPSTWKHGDTDFLYDLYAVCNHHGGMHGGHYTAYCRNSVDGHWYSYDDSSVELVPEEELCTRGAYILFYQRRNVIPPWSANSSARVSTSSSMSDHWLIRLNGDSKRGSMVSRSSTTCPSTIPDSPESPVFQNEPSIDKGGGGFETRPFVRGIQGRSISMKSPTKTRMLPLRWSFGNKDRHKPASAPDPAPAELVEYLESGRRPRCTKDPIVALMTRSSDKKVSKENDSRKPAAKSSSHSSIAPLDYLKIPQGQASSSKKDTGQQSSSNSRPREDGTLTLTRRSSRKSKQEQTQSRKSSSAGLQSSSCGTDSWETTLRNKPSKERDQPDEKQKKGLETKRHDSVFAFLKGGFMKDSLRRSRDSETMQMGDVGVKSLSPSRVSISNGTHNRTSEGKADSNNQGHSRLGGELANGKVSRGLSDIKRSQSSSNIQSKLDPGLRRTASLHRNGTTVAQPQSTPGDRGSQHTQQRTRYSTNSLGRKKAVPESSF
ncbi:ubiquitin carboxyl-terminal hydrolase 43a isoform X2 [Pimephales promelas]|uniref:ubiquitin carboxyl-terminal hydrolase 43a isoform X2 n=1 Tax=Pimephales promelas TaxID=90988 RepID=UPI001955D276|nr:ubiquitin carboxyl-terminal hydrolase 43a isoform X2 [Pimephales promelas]KAG1940752.1 ubiquitin carboxyl-terminal hydrolase [Pimephales promelas]